MLAIYGTTAMQGLYEKTIGELSSFHGRRRVEEQPSANMRNLVAWINPVLSLVRGFLCLAAERGV